MPPDPAEQPVTMRIPDTAPRAETWHEFGRLSDAEGRALLAHMVKRCDQTRLRAVWDALTRQGGD